MSIARELTLSDLPKWFEELGDRLANVDLTRAFKVIALSLKRDAQKCFNEGRSPDGEAWKPLKNPRHHPTSERYKKAAQKNQSTGDSERPLRDNGALMGSLTGSSANHVEDVTPSSLNWGTNLEYAVVQNFGHTFPPAKAPPGTAFPIMTPNGVLLFRNSHGPITIPARPFIGISSQMEETINNVLRDEVSKQL